MSCQGETGIRDSVNCTVCSKHHRTQHDKLTIIVDEL